ncbi:DNA/RNA non-specific endonuclease [Nocardiopsis sp. CNS-639]|uniref:DNA/RNA non-specific endonuclease n=1 Tax=Nocardiopsis sp. CNS-639 TaxID=1169153 RepID=UPI001E43A83D|nr:DNA/RNA non-specific endonuclease [Nocardiopsis sp. CNS-639]
MCTPTGGLINPAAFPIPTASPATLERQAGDLRREGANVAGIGGDIKSAWAGLSSCYSAPEAETLYAVVDPVATDGDKVETSFDKAASALETFAEAVRDIKGKWATLKTDSYAFLNSIEGDDDWREADGFIDSLLGRESEKVEEHQALLDRADALRREYEEAERACANAINADIPDRTNFVAGDGDGESAPGEFEHGYDGYLGDVAMAWGGPMETDHGWWVDAGSAVGDFFVGIAEDVGGITGMYSSEGWFEMSWGDAMWEYHEGNLQSLASLAGMYDSESDSWGWSGWDTVGNAWKDAAHAVVPWEEWSERPGYVIGTALLNIGATVGGAALTATGVGAVVGVPLMAWRGSAMLNRMGGDGPSVPDVDVPDMSRINLSLPRFGNVSLADLRIDLGQLREGAFSTSRLSEMQNLLSRFTGGGFFGGGDNPGGNGSGGDGNGNGSEGSNSQRVANHHGDEEGGPADTRPAVDPTTRELDDSRELLELLTSRPDSAELGDLGRRVLGGEGGDSDAPRPNRSGQSDLEELGLDPSLEAVFSDMNAHASDYPAWEARQSPDGPESGRVPALVGGGNNDTFEGSQDVPNPPSYDRVDLTGTGGDGPHRFPDDHRDADFGDDGPQMRDRTPTVTNSTGGNGSDPLDTGGNSHRGTDVLDGSGDGGGNTHSTGGSGRGPGDTRPGSAGGDILGGRGGQNDGPENTPIRNQPDLRPESTDPGVRELLPRDGLRFGEIRDDNGNVSNRVLEPNSRYRLYEPGSDLHTDYVTDADGNIREIRTESKGWNSEHPEYLNPRPDMIFNVDGYTYRTDEYGRTVSVEGTLHKEPNVRNENEQSKVNSQGSDYYEQLNQKIRDDFETANGRPPEAGEVPQYQDIQWDGGHLIGYAEFFGIGERLNMVPMRFDVNQNRTETALDDIPEEVRGGIEGSYRNIERSWRGIMRDKGSWHGFTNPKFNDGSWDAALALNPNNPKIEVKINLIYDPNLPPVYDKSGKRHLPPPSRIEASWHLNGVDMGVQRYNNVPPFKK